MMLSKTELWPAMDGLKDADRHLAYVKGSIRHIKSVENKQIVNDLVGAIEAQRKAVGQMLQVLDVVARHDFCNGRLQESQDPDAKMVDRKETRKRRARRELPAPAQSLFPVSTEHELVPSEQST
jgi:hypothetical protein